VRAEQIGQRGPMRLGLHAHARHVELARDGREFTHLLTAGDRDEFKALSFSAQHVEGLDADGSRSSQQRHAVTHVRHH